MCPSSGRIHTFFAVADGIKPFYVKIQSGLEIDESELPATFNIIIKDPLKALLFQNSLRHILIILSNFAY